jgi:hypothetical protein
MTIILDGTTGITTPDLTDSSLTSGRVVYAGTSGNLTGSAALTFDGTNLGVGGTASTLLHVQNIQQGVSGKALRLSYNATYYADYSEKAIQAYNNDLWFGCGASGTEQMRLTTTGLGIGTSSPASKLEVVGNLSNSVFGSGSISITSTTTTNNGADGTPSIGFRAPYSSNTTPSVLYASIVGGKENSNVGQTSGYISFSTSPLASSGVVERARIDSNGRFGIGTTTPDAKLSVYGGLTTTGIVARFLNPVSGGNSKIGFTDTLTYNWTVGTTNDNFTVSSGEYSTIAGTERMRIDSSGNFGIGTSSPSYKLDVFGTFGDLVSFRQANVVLKIGTTNLGNGEVYYDAYPTASPSAKSAQIWRQGSTESMRLDANGNLLVGTTSLNNASGTVVEALGSSNFIDKSSASVAQNGTVDLAVGGAGASFTGFLSVTNVLVSNAAVRTQTLYAVFGRGTSLTATSLATGNGSTSGASFTLTCPSNGTLRITNTYAGNTQVNMTWTGHIGG